MTEASHTAARADTRTGAGHDSSGGPDTVGGAGLPMDARRRSHTFPPETIAQIQRMAHEGHYEIRGWGAKRALPLPVSAVRSASSRGRSSRNC